MALKDPRVDSYIEQAAPFAQPLLRLLRTAVHAGCPEAEETIKWRMPFFMHGGRILGHMAAFKQHCALGFWHGREAAERGKDAEAMGQFGRISCRADLPSAAALKAIVKAVAARMDEGAASPRDYKAASKAASKASKPTRG